MDQGSEALPGSVGPLRPAQNYEGSESAGEQEIRWRTVRQGQKLEPGVAVAKMWFPKATRDRDSRQAS